MGEPGDAVVTILRTRTARGGKRSRLDAGVTLVELMLGMAIGMIGFALVGTVLVTAQKQQRVTTDTARHVDEARLAVSRLANDVREARTLTQQGADAAAWFDGNRNGVQDAGEVVVYGFRPDGASQMLVRVTGGATETLLRGIDTGSLQVSIQRTAMQLAVRVTLPPDPAGRGGVTLTSTVVTRGNG